LVQKSVLHQPLVTDIVETAFDITFEHPSSGVFTGEMNVASFQRIMAASVATEAVRSIVSECFGYGFEGEEVKGLHGSVFHCRDTKRTEFSVLLLDIHPAKRQGFVAFTDK